MSNTSLTECVCDRCGLIDLVKERLGRLPPVGWGAVSLEKRLKGRAWANSDTVFIGIVCPACIEAIGKFLRMEE